MQKQATMAQRHPKRSKFAPTPFGSWAPRHRQLSPPSVTIRTVTSRQYLPNKSPCYRSCDSSCDRSCYTVTVHVTWSCQVISQWQLQIKLRSLKSTVLKLATACNELDIPVDNPSGTSRHRRRERTLLLVNVHGQQWKKDEQSQISDKYFPVFHHFMIPETLRIVRINTSTQDSIKACWACWAEWRGGVAAGLQYNIIAVPTRLLRQT